jgi:primosomal protein N' (replication factor Y) (superfamily II helicase)
MYAEIIIPLYLPQNYTWQIPAEQQLSITVGARVEVSLRKRKYAGIVKSISNQAPTSFAAQPIHEVLDAEPIIWPYQLAFWEWMAQWYFCTEGEVMQAALPAYFKLSSESILVFNQEIGENFSFLPNDAFLLAEALFLKKEITATEAQAILGKKNINQVLKILIQNNICTVYESLHEQYKPRVETFIQLATAYQNEKELEALVNGFTKAPKQLELLLAFIHIQQTQGEVSQKELLEKANATSTQLKGLIEKEILVAAKRNVDRQLQGPQKIEKHYSLSPKQNEAFLNIQNAFLQHKITLLHGVTGSGKTEIYFELIAQLLTQGEAVLYLMPEIALTAQMIRRLQKVFGGYVAVYHSKLNPNDRLELWHKVKKGEVQLVLGARSSLFLPFKKLGLIIVDEEHDGSYKQQDPAPRYHARDAAIYLAKQLQANVLLGSATPSYESYFAAQEGKYALVELKERFNQTELPPIEIVDAATIPKKEKGKVFFSEQIKRTMEAVLKNNGQIIVFQNRRGHSPTIQCQVCDWMPGCTQCKSNLTFHKLKNKLVCHYCQSQYAVMNTCPSCKSHQFVYKNFGTEKIEEIILEQFPMATCKRMDVDAIKGKNDVDNLLKLFEQRRVDILVGTQMVVKGLDFDNVQLVIIPDGDGLFQFADFRVNERAFQLIEQVSGRSGRKNASGFVLLQLYNTLHPVLNKALAHNYVGLYKEEMEKRRQYYYPPFSRLLQIEIKHKDRAIAAAAASFLAKKLQEQFAVYLSGPAEPVINRIRNYYIQNIMVKLPKHSETINQFRLLYFKTLALMQQEANIKQAIVIADMDFVY